MRRRGIELSSLLFWKTGRGGGLFRLVGVSVVWGNLSGFINTEEDGASGNQLGWECIYSKLARPLFFLFLLIVLLSI